MPKKVAGTNVQVFGRIRPCAVVNPELEPTAQVLPCGKKILYANRTAGLQQEFPFDLAFGQAAEQDDVFREIGPRVQDAVLGGKSACVMAYGQTGSGKTHTIIGSKGNPGVAPRLLDALLEHTVDERVSVHATAIEIYNEGIYDLLASAGGAKSAKHARVGATGTFGVRGIPPRQQRADTKLKLREVRPGHFAVPGAMALRLARGQGQYFLDRALSARTVGETNMNAQSSRSHMVIMVEYVQELEFGGTLVSNLYLADLAGSEDLNRSKAEGAQVTEAAHINLSLTALRRVIADLAEQRAFVGYRNSVLTALLKPALGGSAATYLICNVSPAYANVQDTRNTLLFAQTSTKVQNFVTRTVKKTYEELEAEVEQTRAFLAKLEGNISALRAELGGDAVGSAVSSEFVCPLARGQCGSAATRGAATTALRAMENPVIAADGKTYDYAALRHRWRVCKTQPAPAPGVRVDVKARLFWIPNNAIRRQLFEPSPTSYLPFDVLAIIFSFSHHSAVAEACLVNWHWNNAAHDEDLWEEFIAREHPNAAVTRLEGENAMMAYFRLADTPLQMKNAQSAPAMAYGVTFISKGEKKK